MKRSTSVKVGVLLALLGVLAWALVRSSAPPPNTLTPGDACALQADAWCYGERGWCEIPSPFARAPTRPRVNDAAAREARRRADRRCYSTCARPYQARCLEHRSMDELTSVDEARRLRAAIETVQASWRR